MNQSKKQNHKPLKPAQSDTVAVSSRSGGANETPYTGDTAEEQNKKPDSVGKFFYLWFGIPLVIILACAWAMGHC